MKTYNVIYTVGILIEAENEEEALSIAIEKDLNDFTTIDVEVEEY